MRPASSFTRTSDARRCRALPPHGSRRLPRATPTPHKLFAAAISDRTALILRVHPSNFRIEGFTERPSLADLVSLGRRFNVPIAEDLGSGWFGWPDRADLPRPLADEPIVSDSIEAGADLV